jgi:hypothetical protein
MGWLAKKVFEIGYYPIQHQSVKQDFISWYFEAAKDQKVLDGLESDNSKLAELSIQAAEKAERFEEVNEVVQLIDGIEEYLDILQTYIYYIIISFTVLGIASISGFLSITDTASIRMLIIKLLLGSAGVFFSSSAIIVLSLYKVITHQIKSNAELVTEFNKELTERPGDIRRNEREWEMLAAQYFWNCSLTRPATIMVLVILSVVKVVSARLYGRISADLRYSIRDFIGKNAREILKIQLSRAFSGDIPPYSPPDGLR